MGNPNTIEAPRARLERVLNGIVEITDETPSPNCKLVGLGFCTDQGVCDQVRELEEQAQAGGLTDKQLAEAALSAVVNAENYGCNGLRLRDDL